MLSLLALAAVFAFRSSADTTTSTGQVPASSLGARDVFSEFKLPPLLSPAGDASSPQVLNLQVIMRAGALGVSPASATEAWKEAEATFSKARQLAAATPPRSPVAFKGTRASQLNALLAGTKASAVVVTSGTLSLDVPIHIPTGPMSLDLGAARLREAVNMPFAVRIQNARGVRLRGGVFDGNTWGVLVADSQDVVITDVTMTGSQTPGVPGRGGVLITNSEEVTVWRNRFQALGGAAVLLHGSSHRVTVADNEIFGGLGSSNWNAGVVITDRMADLATQPDALFQPGMFWAVEQPITTRLKGPEDNVVAFNHIAENASSGIYSDGSVRNVFVGNRVERNSKEGLCLDYGSTADVVVSNQFRGNGKRWGKSDTELKQDFVLSAGRLPDGSSSAKVPAISLDNAAYNQILLNQIDGNFGGGIKLVRTSVYNVLGLNTLMDNNEGQSEHFHFFGIELGAAKLDQPSAELDAAPSRANEVFGNIVRGNHYTGIFFAEGSDQNTLFDNSIFGATHWAMESVVPQSNATLNNLTNLPLRNITSGLDPQLLILGRGRFDTPPPALDPKQPDKGVTTGDQPSP